MKKLILAISVFLLFGSSFANAEQVYYCASELNAGIIKDQKTGKWRKGNFEDERYTLKFNDDYTKLDGLSAVHFNCFIPFGSMNTMRVCYGNFNGGELFQFDKNTLRFFMLHGSIYGYLDNGVDDNWITGGTCEKF